MYLVMVVNAKKNCILVLFEGITAAVVHVDIAHTVRHCRFATFGITYYTSRYKAENSLSDYVTWLDYSSPHFCTYDDITGCTHRLHRHLTGPIPAALSRLRNLRVLHLGANKLSGELPLFFVFFQSVVIFREGERGLSHFRAKNVRSGTSGRGGECR